MLVDVLLILHASETTRITVHKVCYLSLFQNIFPSSDNKSGGTTDHVKTDSPYNGAPYKESGLSIGCKRNP